MKIYYRKYRLIAMYCFGFLALFVAVVLAAPTQKSVVRVMLGRQYKDVRYEEHNLKNGQHFILVVNEKAGHRECHTINYDGSIDVGIEWAGGSIRKFARNLKQYITWSHSQGLLLTKDVFRTRRHDPMAVTECNKHKIYLMDYSPYFQPPQQYYPKLDAKYFKKRNDTWDFQLDPDDSKQVAEFLKKVKQ